MVRVNDKSDDFEPLFVLEPGDDEALQSMAKAYLWLKYDYDSDFLADKDWGSILARMRARVMYGGRTWDEILDAAGEYAREQGFLPSVDDAG